MDIFLKQLMLGLYESISDLANEDRLETALCRMIVLQLSLARISENDQLNVQKCRTNPLRSGFFNMRYIIVLYYYGAHHFSLFK